MSQSSIVRISLTHDQIAIVDRADFEKYALDSYTWHASWSPHTKTWYARSNRKISHDQSLPRCIRLHCLIMEARGRVQVDHRNGDTLDNCRQNLRFATHAQNMHNRKMDWDNKSGFKGVAPKRHCITGKYNGRYSATIRVDGKIEHIGYFGSPEEAARA